MIDLLKFKFGADDSETAAATRRMKTRLGGIRGALAGVNDYAKRAGRSMRNIGAGLTVGVTAPIGLAVRSSLEAVDAQAKMARSMGTTVVSLQNLARASELAGISQTDLGGSLRRVTRRVSLAERGLGPAVKALDQLGLSAETLNGLPLDERVDKINTAIRRFVPEAQQAGVVSEIFGDRTGLAMLRLDSDTIAQATREVERFGVGMSDVDASKIEEANDAFTRIGLAARGLANQLAVALLPLAEQVEAAIAWFGDLSAEVKHNIVVFGGLAAAAGPLLTALGLGSLLTALTGVAQGIVRLAPLLGTALATPLGALVGVVALVAAAAYFLLFRDNAKTVKTPLEKAREAQEALNAALGGLLSRLHRMQDAKPSRPPTTITIWRKRRARPRRQISRCCSPSWRCSRGSTRV